MPLQQVVPTIKPVKSAVKRSRLLIVDDDPTQLRFYLQGLNDVYHCQFASSASEAVTFARQFPQPDLIILDVVLPDVNGFEICQILKEDQLTSHIPVIFVSGQDDVESKLKGFEHGCVDYISKPVLLPEMQARISTHIKLKQQTIMLESLAYTDPLTQVGNRRKYNETLQREWARSIRYGQPIAMLLMDIDYFKQFNDFYGHGVGDDCLIKICSHLRDLVNRPGDLFARIGGEEFVILLTDCGIEGALRKADEVLRTVSMLNIANQGAPKLDRVTLSIGVAVTTPKHQEEPLTLFQAADEALYEAKHSGRNKFSVSKLMDGTQTSDSLANSST
ncbi:diguanylate cyclase domain-containing protein [Brumicola blandensis]|uniref:diguanylate cyclase n=1 Tax=Brumicola blandensis TaxID=3075611 RepID=A0AAW8R691_9ALTE|nr:diguanylate cyclase [Alteromonas sp. W409]MDT0583656.1 diguanylate cyclase [Alteromonas sp. W409]